MKEYDWKCSKCGRKLTLPAETKARWCCGKRMVRVYQAPPVVWKTPGFTRPIPRPKKERKDD